MRVSTLLSSGVIAAAALVAACSSSSSSGGSSGYPTCQGATGSTGPGSSACSSCVESNCGSDVSSVESACGAYLSCYEGCQCSDLSCIENCESKITGNCSSAETPLSTCLSQHCASQCSGETMSDGGTGGG